MPYHLSLECELLKDDPGILEFTSQLDDTLNFLSFNFSTKEI